MPWPVTASEVVYSNRWITVEDQQVTMPDGRPGQYGLVTMVNDAVFVVALTDADEILLVDIDRHTVGRSLEVPAGGTDGDDPLVAAQRELLEETGHSAAEWVRLGGMDALNGVCRAPEHVYLARGLTPARDATDDQHEEGIAAVRAIPIPEVLQLVRTGGIRDGETLAALLLALLELGRVA